MTATVHHLADYRRPASPVADVALTAALLPLIGVLILWAVSGAMVDAWWGRDR